MIDVFEVLKDLNKDKDRCALIGRNGLNYSLLAQNGRANPFSTYDYDIICPDLAIAEESAAKLGQSGFIRNGATFSKEGVELDMLLADQNHPEGVIGGYYNVPSLRTLWNSRARVNGILVPDAEALILNKLLNARENEGKDLDTVKIYFSLKPDRLKLVINNILEHEKPEERETMLYSLYASMADSEESKKAIEPFLLKELEHSSGALSEQKKNGGQ
jgi:hypothetical protein